MPKKSNYSAPDLNIYGLRYNPPQVMPGGWWDSLTGLAEWVENEIRRSYESGYWAGRLDGKTERAADKRLTDSGIDDFLRGFGSKSPS